MTCFDSLRHGGRWVARSVIRKALSPPERNLDDRPGPFAQDELQKTLRLSGRHHHHRRRVDQRPVAPGSALRDGGCALGAQAGERNLREVLVRAGFTASPARRPRAPLNLVARGKSMKAGRGAARRRPRSVSSGDPEPARSLIDRLRVSKSPGGEGPRSPSACAASTLPFTRFQISSAWPRACTSPFF